LEKRPQQQPNREQAVRRPGLQQNSADKPSMTSRPPSTGPKPKK